MRSARCTVPSRWAMMIAGAAAQQAIHGLLQQPLGGRVQARRRLVQDDHAGILQEDAGEGQQLRLAGGEPAAAGGQLGIQAMGQGLVPVSRPSSPSAARMRASGIWAVEEGQVIAHGGVEQLDILGDHAHAGAQIGHPAPAQVHAAQAAPGPRVGSYRRNSRRASVVLPLPVRPSRPSTVPGSRRNETSRRAQRRSAPDCSGCSAPS